MKRIYLDYAATTPTNPEVIREMLPYFNEIFGNPSSLHYFGRQASSAVEKSRSIAAGFIGARPEEIIFTSGGTESDNFALKGTAWANRSKGNHIITSNIEHHAVFESCIFLEENGFSVTYLPVAPNGILDPDVVKKAITKDTILISIMHANNEIGTIQPVKEIGKIAKENSIYFHIDAVQSFGHIPLNVDDLNIDMLSASAHKLYGPKGIGLLYIRKGTRIQPFMTGGGQEKKLRASTHNVPGIVGFGKAIELAAGKMQAEAEFQKKLRNKLINNVLENIDNSKLNGDSVLRLPNNANLSIKFVEGEGIILGLDLEGIAASSGSACTSGSLEPSHVLKAIGRAADLARGSVRFSLGRYNTEEEIDYTIEKLTAIIKKLRKMSPLLK
ncbi:MAG: cysteine desulfurase NifS [Actinobacteria bacterium]|nr:cysteine desulfurase NifS [Actinomycetota bacterium]MCL6088357.1 cysteine desulfurase NifS [Actinomycetota bacterium]